MCNSEIFYAVTLRSIDMKKILSLIFATVLTFALAMFAVSCGNETTEAKEAPIVFSFTTYADESYCALKSVTISEDAQKLVNAKDYKGLAKLFNTPVEDANYAKPEVEYTEESVRVLQIPTEYGKFPVKKILSDAVSGQTFIKKIVVGDNIETIEQGAFSLLTGLEEIELPFVGSEYNALNEKKLFGYIFGSATADGITSITQTYNEGTNSTATFSIPSSLKKAVINGGNKIQTETLNYKLDTDDDGNDVYVFEGDEKFDQINGITYSLTRDTSEYSVAPYAFYNCSTIKEVEIKGDYAAVEDYTFYGCTSIEELAFPENIVKIGAYAYAGCTSLKTIDFNAVTEIGEGAFNNCSALGTAYLDGKNPIDLSAVTSVGKNAFSNCTGLEVVKLGNAVIGERAFASCTSLKDLTFDNAEIGYASFYSCTAIEEVNLENVTKIGDVAFYGCTELKDYTLKADAIVGKDAFGNTAAND